LSVSLDHHDGRGTLLRTTPLVEFYNCVCYAALFRLLLCATHAHSAGHSKDNSESKVIPLWPSTPDAPRILYLRVSSSQPGGFSHRRPRRRRRQPLSLSPDIGIPLEGVPLCQTKRIEQLYISWFSMLLAHSTIPDSSWSWTS
jgi:hypothetical protein